MPTIRVSAVPQLGARIRPFVLTLGFVAACLAAAAPAGAQDQTYNQPRFRDMRLDWCLTWGADCGRPAAVEFCRRRRFEDVVVFRAEVVGRSQPTRLLGSDQVCSGEDFCTAFAYITCTGPIPHERVFQNPDWNGHRLDVCLRWGEACGKPAADAFCRKRGFAESFHSTVDAEPGRGTTRVISTDQICDGPYCRGFQQIICR